MRSLIVSSKRPDRHKNVSSAVNNISIIGHEKIEKELAQSIISGKVFPTWIFCGPFGIGKTCVAKKFAKCLLSGFIPSIEENKDNADIRKSPLDVPENDEIHRLVELHTHPDFFILEESATSISIDDTRNLMQKIHKKPTLSKWRVIIIENASGLNNNIYNSMLKILEEPPKNTVIIMICQNTGRIPRTLLSRANKINFNPLKDAQVQKILENNGIAKGKEAVQLAKIANGSVGYARYLKENNGIEIFSRLLKVFGNGDKKSLQYIIENGLVSNFVIIKESLLKIFRMYMEGMIGITDLTTSDENANVFKRKTGGSLAEISSEIKKITEIIFMINRSEGLMLDKQTVLAYAFEKFLDC